MHAKSEGWRIVAFFRTARNGRSSLSLLFYHSIPLSWNSCAREKIAMSFEAALAEVKCSVKNHTRYFSHSIAYVKEKFVRIATNPKCYFHIYQYLLCANWPSTKSTFLCTNENCTDSPLYLYAKICSQTSLAPYRVLALEAIVIMIWPQSAKNRPKNPWFRQNFEFSTP